MKTKQKLSDLIVNEKGQLTQDFLNGMDGMQIVGLMTWWDDIDKYQRLGNKIKRVDYVYLKDTF